MKILILGNRPQTPRQMSWIAIQRADLIFVAGEASDEGELNPRRSWVLRLPVAAGNLESGGGHAPEWIHELRHVRLAINQTGGKKSIPVVFLPSPSPSKDDEWYAAAKRNCLDAADFREPRVLITHYPLNEMERPTSEEILTLRLSDAVRPTITVCGVTRILKSQQSQQQEVRIDSGENDGPIPRHAWIFQDSPTGPIRFRDSRGSTSY
ncbi:MAG: hypothetical protein ACOYM3_14915 [Terrimicrobiaceae bacterium]